MKKIDLTKSYFPIIIISCLGIIVYSNTFHCSFHFDDFRFIVDNFAIKNIPNLFNHWKFYPCRFITFLSITLNYHFNGLNVFGYHLFNLAVHLSSAIFVWWLTLLTFSTPAMNTSKITAHARLISLLTGLIFVSHPVQTEAVTYIWQRASSMAALFYLASLCLYVKSRLLVGRGRTYYIFSLIIAIAAMFTKENAVTLPLMILLYEICFFENKKGLNWRYLSPFLLTLFIIPLTMFITKAEQFKAIQKFEESGGISPIHYLLTQFRVIVTYIKLMFLPLNQNISYDYPISKSIFEFPTLISILFLASIIESARHLFFKYRLVAFSIFWFFLTLSLESSIFPLKNIIFEHRLYLPLVGYSMFLVCGVYYILGKNNIKTMVILLTMVIVFNSILTYQRNKVWKNEVTLWGDAAQKSPFNPRPYNGLAVAYVLLGDLNSALSEYNKAIEIDPNYAEAYNGRGNIYRKQNKLPQALSDYNRVIHLDPTYAEVYYNLGIFYDKQNNLPQALSNYNKAVAINPNLEEAYYNRGNTYTQQGDFTRAIADYMKTINIDPNYAKAYNNLGNIYIREGNLAQALSNYNKTIETDPTYTEAYINRGNAYSQQGNFTQALSDYDKVITINPNDAQAYINRAIAYYLLKEYDRSWNDVHTVEALGGTVNPHFINALKRSSPDK